MANNPNVHLRNIESYANYRDQRDEYEYHVSLKKDSYLCSEYELDKGVLDLMYTDELLNDRVYKQLYQDVCDREYKTRCRAHISLFYLPLFLLMYIHVSYWSSSDPGEGATSGRTSHRSIVNYDPTSFEP